MGYDIYDILVLETSGVYNASILCRAVGRWLTFGEGGDAECQHGGPQTSELPQDHITI